MFLNFFTSMLLVPRLALLFTAKGGQEVKFIACYNQWTRCLEQNKTKVLTTVSQTRFTIHIFSIAITKALNKQSS